MSEFSVRVQAETEKRIPGVRNIAASLADDLDPFGACCTYTSNGKSIAVRLALTADSARLAAEEAENLVANGLAARNVNGIHVTSLEAVAADVLELENNTPQFPRLVGTAEAAQILGVSRQRATKIMARDDFPEPLARLAGGAVWAEDGVRLYAEGRTRKPGRPKNTEDD